MTEETDLKLHIDSARDGLPGLRGGHNRLRAYLDILVAERLLAGPQPEAPSRWARVHMLGHQQHVGEVQQLHGGALLVHGIDASIERGVYRYHFTAEQKGRHSIEWLSEAEWAEHVATLEKDHAAAVERVRRSTTWPEGCVPVERPQRTGPRHGFRCAAGLNGFWWSDDEARGAAWEYVDEPYEFPDRSIEAAPEVEEG